MKLLKVFTIMLIALAFMSVTAFGQTIVGSDHDFSGKNWNPDGEICAVCHTPHNAQDVTDAPLWNHQVTTATFTVYNQSVSPTLDATVGQPDGASKLCLSCHDGTVALDNFGANIGSNSTNFIDPGHNIGTNLSDDHPVSFVYDATLASTDGGLNDPATTNIPNGGTIESELLFNGKLQCASCHDVHNGSGNEDLLRIDNSGSALCLTCHNK